MNVPFDFRPPSPFIFSAGKAGLLDLRSTRETVFRMAAVVRQWYDRYSTEPGQPLQFPAGHPMTPEFIAACWHAGVPYWIEPAATVPGLTERASRLLNPLPYRWRHALNEYLDCNGDAFAAPVFSPDPDAVFSYLFTSGSSGAPKLVALRRSQMLAAFKSMEAGLLPDKLECWLLCLPLNHIGGTAVVLRSWLNGNSVVDARMASYEDMLAQLSGNESLALASLVPSQLDKLLDLSGANMVHPNFKAVLLGGGPSPNALIEEARSRAVPVMKSYGMTETCAHVISVPADALLSAPFGCSGKPNAGHEIQIRDESGAVLPAGETGLLWVRGPQLITGYADAPAGTEAAFDAEGWFCTGDYARTDAGGWVYIEMRRSDLVVSGGENINPGEVEAILRSEIAGITDIVVGGLPDARWGQKLVAWLVLEGDKPDAETLRITLKKVMPPYMVPAEFRFPARIPRNEMGKIQREALENLF